MTPGGPATRSGAPRGTGEDIDAVYERAVLYGRAGCHLCDEARQVLARECERAGAGWREVDVDSDPALRERYGELVPVVEVDGVQQGYWRIDAARLRTALAAR